MKKWMSIWLTIGVVGSWPARGAPPPDRRDAAILAELDSDFASKIVRVLEVLRTKGWKARVAEGRRTVQHQQKKVADKVSKTMKSLHLCGKAADIIDSRYAWDVGKGHAFWQDLATAAKAEGLVWGGDWQDFEDVAHVEAAGSTCNWSEFGL